MQKKILAKVSSAALVVAGLAAGSLAVAGPAAADIAPTGSDAVAVGSDTVQYVADFVIDGDNAGDGGYNGLGKNRVFSFDATADAAGRAVYGPGGVAATPNVVLRQSANPVARPNGSGAGIKALLNDSANHQIDFVRSSRLPNSGEATTAKNDPKIGGLHVFQVATDGLQIATATTTNAPASLTAQNIADIYSGKVTTWNQVGGTSTATIIPILPQSGSGTRGDFTGDIKSKTGTDIENGSKNPNLVIGEEHDPTLLTNNPNAIAPFSTGRFNLIQSGYLGSNIQNVIKLVPNNGTNYYLGRSLYFIARQVDVTSTKPFQAGTKTNLVNTLFGTPDSALTSGDVAGNYAAAGVVAAWADKGNFIS